ncbi:hypothetical protein ACFL7D_03655 [candidate division KSB1 bacterium]
MKNCVKFQKLFFDALSQKLNDEQQIWFDTHLEKCEKCVQEYTEAASVVDIFGEREISRPDKQYWDSYWERLSQKIDTEPVSKPAWKDWWEQIVHTIIFKPRIVYRPVAAMLLISVGILVGQVLYNPGIQQTDTLSAGQTVDKAELEKRIQKYLNRSKVMLSSFVNYDSATENIEGLDLPSQKRISRELIKEAQFINTELVDQEREQLLELIIELQMTLLQVVQFENGGNELEIELLQSNIIGSALLLKINLEGINRITGLDNS